MGIFLRQIWPRKHFEPLWLRQIDPDWFDKMHIFQKLYFLFKLFCIFEGVFLKDTPRTIQSNRQTTQTGNRRVCTQLLRTVPLTAALRRTDADTMDWRDQRRRYFGVLVCVVSYKWYGKAWYCIIGSAVSVVETTCR